MSKRPIAPKHNPAHETEISKDSSGEICAAFGGLGPSDSSVLCGLSVLLVVRQDDTCIRLPFKPPFQALQNTGVFQTIVVAHQEAVTAPR
jgi:hypothetical protein